MSLIKSISLFQVLFLGRVYENEGFATLDLEHSPAFASRALHPEGDFFGGFGLLMEDRLGLTAETRLLHVISSSSLGASTFLTLLKLSHLVVGVLLAFLAMSLAGLQDAHLSLSYYHRILIKL